MEENNMLSNAFDKLGEILGTEDGQKQISDILSAFSGFTGGEEDTGNPDNQDYAENNAESSNPLSGLSGILNSSALSDIFNNSNKESASAAPDISDISGMSGILSALMSQGTGKNNPNSAFLQALKPYLRSERRQKVDSAIKILSFASVFKEFGGLISSKGGD